MANNITEEPDDWRSSAALLPGFMLIVWILVIVRTAWLCDDAFITFRTVDNFIHGRGLTWNPGERVWVYTHTLWMWVMSVASFVTREIPNTALILCLLVSGTAAGLLVFRIASGPIAGSLALLCLIMSRSFVDYSTSGLENPLTHLLLVAMMMAWMRPEPDTKRLFLICLIGGLGMLTRHDLMLLFGPAMAAEFFFRSKATREARLRWALLGVLPFVLWEVFVIFYYGFPVPNTAFAKLNNGIPGGELFRQGLTYYIVSLQWDPLALAMIAAGVAAGLRKSARRDFWPFAAGIVLYCLYLLKIGGDSMAGRFLTAPAFAALLMLVRVPMNSGSPVILIHAGLITLLGLGALRPVYTITADYDETFEKTVPIHGIADERSYYHERTALSSGSRKRFADPGISTVSERLELMKMETFVSGAVGMQGFYAGKDVHIIDAWALGDALIAHLPARAMPWWRIGHYERLVPPGYFETVESGENRIKDAKLADYYDRLHLVISGPLFSFERIKEIARFNLGLNEGLVDLQQYRAPTREFQDEALMVTRMRWVVDIPKIARELPEGAGLWARLSIPFEGYRRGGRLRLGEAEHYPVIRLRVSAERDIMVRFLRDGEVVGEVQKAGVASSNPEEPPAIVVEVPDSVSDAGYDELLILRDDRNGRGVLTRIEFLSTMPEGGPTPDKQKSSEAPREATDRNDYSLAPS